MAKTIFSEYLDDLAKLLLERAPTASDGTTATLSAILVAEPVIGEVAVACWAAPNGDEQFDLVRFPDGKAIRSRTAIRETLTLLAMVETLEELAHFEMLDELKQGLTAWENRVTSGEPLKDALTQALDAVNKLAKLAPPEGGRIARTQILDEIGASLRAMEDAWERLEQAADLWSDKCLEEDKDAIEDVQELWRTLGIARRGPLAHPPSTALHAGREAGASLAKAISETPSKATTIQF